MTIIKQDNKYYHLAERKSYNVNSVWKALHITLYLVICASGFITAVTFGGAIRGFDDRCIIYSQLVFGTTPAPTTAGASSTTMDTERRNLTTTTIEPINIKKTVWSAGALCNYCQFIPIMSMIFGFVWAVFFFMCAKGGKGYEHDILLQPWRIVYSALFFASLFMIFIFASTIFLTRGLIEFCTTLVERLGDLSCDERVNKYTLVFYEYEYDVYSHIKICVSCAYVGFGCWVLQIILLLLRIFCVVDFDLIVTTMRSRRSSKVESKV